MLCYKPLAHSCNRHQQQVLLLMSCLYAKFSTYGRHFGGGNDVVLSTSPDHKFFMEKIIMKNL